jgi:uncharacterized protein YceK
MRALLLMLVVMGLLSGCISGKPSRDTYTDKAGKTSVIESDREQCEHSCNDSYSRCMDSTDARSNGGINGPANMFGASSDCRNQLSQCLPACKSR